MADNRKKRREVLKSVSAVGSLTIGVGQVSAKEQFLGEIDEESVNPAPCE